MTVLTAAIALILLAATFLGGYILADRSSKLREQAIREALQRQYLRLRAGVDADDICQPYFHPGSKFTVPPEFADRLNSEGKATVQIQRSERK